MPQLLLGDLDLLADPYMAKVGSSWGEWVAITTTTDSLFLDGSIVSGEQSGNRTIAVQVMVKADPRPSLVRACELLFAEANKAANTLTFVPDEGQRVVYDVFRAQPERTDDEAEAWGYRTYTFTFPALPFTRSGRRVTTGALAPAITVADFDSATTGILLGTGGDRSDSGLGSEFGMPYDNSVAESSWVQVARAPSLTADTNCTVTNGTTYATGRGDANAANVTATASGLVEAHVTAAAATSAAAVTAGVNVAWDHSGRQFQVGVEWLDASSNVVRVDWGDPQYGFEVSQTTSGNPSWTGGTIWVSAARPSSATQVRVRLRAPSGVAGDIYPVLGSAVVPLAQGTISTTTAPTHGGSGAVYLPVRSIDPQTAQTGYVHPSNPQGSGYLQVVLTAPLDISAKPQMQAWASSDGTSMTPVSLRVSDSAGRWSRYDAPTISAVGADFWQLLSWPLTTPSQVSAAGAADLTAVAAVSLSMVRGWPAGDVIIDDITASDAPTATNSSRGTVYQLPIVGSARSTAKVALASTAGMTDLLVASVFSDCENPMLRVVSNVATAPAPACYDGVYSVIGALAPAESLTSPTCVVAQLINGTQVASQTLAGLQAAGNHYVDFGQVALPLVPVPDENTGVSYTFTLAPSSSSWSEALVLNAAASLTWVQNLTTTPAYAWVDEPVLPAQVGRIFVGAAADRTDARGLASPPIQSRPFQVASPSTRLLVYSTSGAPNVTLDYDPHWLVEPDA